MKNSQKGFSIIELLIVVVILAILGFMLLSIITSFTGLHYETGKGEHTGYITAVEKSGLIWKTGKAYIKTEISSSQEDEYCVIDPAVYSKLEELSKQQAKVTIQHKSYFSSGITNCDSEPAIIYSIK